MAWLNLLSSPHRKDQVHSRSQVLMLHSIQLMFSTWIVVHSYMPQQLFYWMTTKYTCQLTRRPSNVNCSEKIRQNLVERQSSRLVGQTFQKARSILSIHDRWDITGQSHSKSPIGRPCGLVNTSHSLLVHHAMFPKNVHHFHTHTYHIVGHVSHKNPMKKSHEQKPMKSAFPDTATYHHCLAITIPFE